MPLRKTKPDILYIGLNDRDPRWHDLYELHLSTGEKTLLRKNTEQIAGWDFDNDGELRLAERTNQAGDTEILRVDADGFKQIYSCTVLENCGVSELRRGQQAGLPDHQQGLAGPDRVGAAGPRDRRDHQDRKRSGEAGRPRTACRPPTSTTASSSPSTRTTASGVYFKDKAFEKEYRWLQSKLPGKEIELRRALQGREYLDRDRVQRHRTGRDLCVEPQGEDAGAAIPHSRRAAARVAVASASRTTSNRRTGWRSRPTSPCPRACRRRICR